MRKRTTVYISRQQIVLQALCCAAPHRTAPHRTALHCSALHCAALSGAVHCTAPH